MRVYELLKNYERFKYRDRVYVVSGPLAIYLYASEHPDAKEVLSFQACTHGGWTAYDSKGYQLPCHVSSRQAIDTGIDAFAEMFGFEVQGS